MHLLAFWWMWLCSRKITEYFMENSFFKWRPVVKFLPHRQICNLFLLLFPQIFIFNVFTIYARCKLIVDWMSLQITLVKYIPSTIRRWVPSFFKAAGAGSWSKWHICNISWPVRSFTYLIFRAYVLFLDVFLRNLVRSNLVPKFVCSCCLSEYTYLAILF